MVDKSGAGVQVVPVEAVNERFDRIEKKIDKLSDAMVSLARTEEKIMAMEADKANITDRINRHSEKLDEITVAVNDNSRTVGIISKVMWIVVTAVVAVFVKSFAP